MIHLDDETTRALLCGIKLFNDGAHFEAHEVWEEAWREEVGATKLFFQGLIKIAAGFYKAERGVPAGAITLLRGGLVLLAPFREAREATGIAVDAFIDRVAECLATLERDPRHPFDPAELPKIKTVSRV